MMQMHAKKAKQKVKRTGKFLKLNAAIVKTQRDSLKRRLDTKDRHEVHY